MKTKIKFIALILALTLICSAFASCVPTPDITTTTTTTTTQKPDTPPDEPHVHTEVVDEAVLPTCTSTGLTEGKHCSECDEVLVPQNEVPMTAHTYDSDVDADCNTCGFVRNINCTHSNIETLAERAATCYSVGYTEGKKCSDCGEILVAQNEIPMTEHTFDDDADLACNACGYVREMKASEGLEFAENEDGTYTVVGIGDCTDTDIVIPEYYNGKEVTAIGDSAFMNNVTITSVKIPNSVIKIYSGAFSSCSKLESVNIPSSVTRIERYAFYGCYEAFTNHNNLFYLGNEENPYYALISAQNTDITFAGIHPDTVLISGAAFEDCLYLTELTLPSKVKYIGEYAFSDCTSLNTLNVGESVSVIEGYAFSCCSSLYSIILPEGLTTINDYAFYDSYFDSVTIPSSVTYIGAYAFDLCSATYDLYYEGTMAEWYDIDFGDYALDGCSATEVTCSDGTVRIK